jgi:hypothetical protein
MKPNAAPGFCLKRRGEMARIESRLATCVLIIFEKGTAGEISPAVVAVSSISAS